MLNLIVTVVATAIGLALGLIWIVIKGIFDFILWLSRQGQEQQLKADREEQKRQAEFESQRRQAEYLNEQARRELENQQIARMREEASLLRSNLLADGNSDSIIIRQVLPSAISYTQDAKVLAEAAQSISGTVTFDMETAPLQSFSVVFRVEKVDQSIRLTPVQHDNQVQNGSRIDFRFSGTFSSAMQPVKGTVNPECLYSLQFNTLRPDGEAFVYGKIVQQYFVGAVSSLIVTRHHEGLSVDGELWYRLSVVNASD